MQKKLTVHLLPSEAAQDTVIRQFISTQLNAPVSSITGYEVIKRSVDSRGKQPLVILSLIAFINEPYHSRHIQKINLRDVTKARHQVLIVGAGPAGLFAALKLIENGIRPVIVERGKNVRTRRRDLAALNKEGIVNPESNYCFGEGGAGTYSDGKLYTRSTKRGDVNRILNIFVQFGAAENILYDSHPHIGTNKLPGIITSIRESILACGGEYLFDKKVSGFIVENNTIKGVTLSDGNNIESNHLILATGHSARDIFQSLYQNNIEIEFKPFALGVRVEHPQSLIDSIQYHCTTRGSFLPPAPYSLVQQVEERGVFSFCMCPGGIIAPAATNPGEIVVNGWSPSRRNNPFANSGIVTAINREDIIRHLKKVKHTAAANAQFDKDPMAGILFQQSVEQRSFEYGGGNLVAPAQRMVDFCEDRISGNLPECSYLPGISPAILSGVLPPFIYDSLAKAFRAFGKKMRGYYTNDAVIVATESRTSSPIRIPRHPETLEHTQVKGLYPCGEGAGYAGGIVSAAMDGERVAGQIIDNLHGG